MKRPVLALLLVQGWVSLERQERLVLPYCDEHRYQLISVSSDPEAALELVRLRLINVVVVCAESRATIALGAEIHDAGGRLEALRPLQRPHRHTSRMSPTAAKEALERGATPEQVALVFGVDLVDVVLALRTEEWGAADERRPARPESGERPDEDRPQRLGDRGERRPARSL